MATTTRAQRLANDVGALVHLLDNVAELSTNAPLRLALSEALTTRLTQFMALDDGLIRQLTYNDAGTGTIQQLSTIDSRNAILLRWFVLYKREEARMDGSTFDLNGCNADNFDDFVQDFSTHVHDDMDRSAFFATIFAPATATTAAGATASASVTSTNNQPTSRERLSEFKKSVKLGTLDFPEFDGAEINWFTTRTKWETTFELEGMLYLLAPSYVVPTNDVMDVELFGMHNSYVYLKLFQNCKTGQARTLALNHTASKDGQQLWLDLIAHYQKPEIVDSVYTSCVSAITSFKLNDFSGPPRKFLNAFAAKLQKITEIAHFIPTKPDLDDSTKISYLEASIGNSHKADIFRQQVDVVNTILRTGTGAAPTFYVYFANLMNAANKYTPPGSRIRSNALTKTGGDAPKWKKDFSVRVPKEIYQKMSKAEQDKRRAAQKAARQARSGSNGNSSPPSITPAQIHALTTALNNLSSQTSPLSTVPSDDASTGGASIAPSIREIMSAITTGTNATPTGGSGAQSFQVNSLRCVRITQNMTTDSYDDLCLIDGGANTGLAGANMVLLEQSEQPEMVQVTDASDTVNSSMGSLPLGTYCAKLCTSKGRDILGVFPNYVGYGRGKSILCRPQAVAHGLDVDETARRHGGKQRVVTTERYVVKCLIKDALTWFKLAKPSDDEIQALPRVYFGSEDWTPDFNDEFDNDDEWFDASDDEELDDDEWFHTMTFEDVDIYDPAFAQPSTAAAASLVSRLINGFRSQVKPRDWDALRPFFAWKPRNVIKHTFGATTQFARNVVRLPLRQHFQPRFPSLNVRRLQEVFATDTFFSTTPAHDGTTMCQLFVGRKSKFTDVYPMKAKSEYPTALLDFIRSHGAMQGIMSDNAAEQVSAEATNILRKYNIKDMQSEPYQQHQNPAERRIQDVKAMTTTVMDRTGAPKKLWLFCLLYCVYVLNRLSHVSLDQRTPLEACFGVTPDISALLCFHFYQEVYYYESDSPFPETRERKGWFLGVSENKGDALTFQILTDSADFKVIDRSVVRPVDENNLNLRAASPHGEDSGEPEQILQSLSEQVMNEETTTPRSGVYFDNENTILPTVDPLAMIGRTFLLDPNEDGEVLRAEVKEVFDPVDGETGLLKVKVGDSDEIMTYDAVIEGINRQHEREATQSSEERVWIYKTVLDHRKTKNGKFEVKVQWEDDQVSWEPLSTLATDDPVFMAQYALDNDLLSTPGWKRFRRYGKSKKKMNRLVRQSKLKSKREGPIIKFGVKVPRNYSEAVEFDCKNGNTLWQDATQTEMSQIYEFGTFRSLGKGAPVPHGFSKIKTWLIFDVKQDGRRKARLVCGGHMTPPSTDLYFSSVASTRAVRLAILLGELNGLKTWVGDIGNAYLTSKTNKKIVFFCWS